MAPFYVVSAIWWVIGVFAMTLGPAAEVQNRLIWFIVLSFIALLDLYSIARLCRGLLIEKNQGSAVVWGSIKLTCLFVFGGVLLRGQAIPTNSVLFGVSTLAVVPLLGAAIGSLRIFRHARGKSI